MKAILSLGANLGEPEKTLSSAVECIKRLPRVRYIRGSSLYITAPVETRDAQPDYINMTAEVEAQCSPRMLLGMCLGIEAAHMRTRPFEKAARTLDIDLILCAEDDKHIIVESAELTLPHPRMFGRGFVLVPLAELYPDGKVFDVDISSALERCSRQGVKLYKDWHDE